jgi:TamB, inner membrane protein subunit of TAM complex
MTTSDSVKKVLRRIFRIFVLIFLILLGIVLLILILIQTGPVQNYGRSKIEAYLENKLHTKVRIGNLYIGFPSRIILKNIYLEDRHKDTLLFGGKIEADISMFKLLSKELRLNNLELDNITMKVTRQMPDTVFNFQFIEDAFSSKPSQNSKPDTSAGFTFAIGNIHLHQIHAIYHDDVSGNDLYVNLGDFKTKLKIFDPAHQTYSISDISLADISGKVRQYKPILILQHMADTISVHNQDSKPVKLELGDIDFTRVNLDYRDDEQNVNAGIRLGHFHLKADSIDLATLHFKLKQVAIGNTTAAVQFGKRVVVKSGKKENPSTAPSHQGNWSIDVASFAIDSTGLKYDDDNKTPVKKGLDYSHLDVHHLVMHTSGLHADPASYRLLVSKIALDEKSGLVLKNLSVQASYNSRGASLKNLILQTNRSEIRNQTTIAYKSLDDLKAHPGDITTNLEFDRARIAVKDVLIFVPSLEGPLKDNERAVLLLNGKVTGYLKDLRIPYLQIDGVGNTSVALSGLIRGLPNAGKAYYDITISSLRTSKNDLYRLIPAKSLPESIRLPQNISANGKFTGTVKRFYVQLHTTTSEGSADVKGNLDLDRKTYDLTASTRAMDLGYILKQDSLLGKITLDATAKGSGFDPKKMNSVFHANLLDADIKDYHYKNLLLDANLRNGNGTVVSSMHDPNLTYQLNLEAEFLHKYPSVKIKLQLDTLNALALNLLKDSLQTHFALVADFSSTNPDALQGRMDLTDLGVTTGGHTLHTDSIYLFANHADIGQSIQLHAEMVDINWTGQYKLTQVPGSLRHFINEYYKIPVSKTDSAEPEKWQMDLALRPSPLVIAMMPSIRGTDSLTGAIHFNSETKDLSLVMHDNKIQFNQQVIHQFNLDAVSKEKSLEYNISVADGGHPGFLVYQSSVYGKLSDNKLLTTLLLKDKKAKNKYVLSGTLSQVNHGLQFVFNPDSLLLNYQPWQLPADNFILYDSAGLIVRNLRLSHQSESLSINTNGETAQSPLDIGFNNFRIKTISQFAEQDSLLMDGTIQGKAEVKNLFTKPLFTSDLKIDTLSFEKDTLGNLVVQLDNKELNAFDAHIALSGQDNDVRIDGKYFTGESKMDIDVKLNQLNLKSFKGVALSQVKNMSGYLKGELLASGNLDKPVLKGSLHFDSAVIVPVITGEPLRLSNDVISFDEDGFNFDNFAMLDSAGNKATLDGNVFTKDFKNYRFDVSFSAQNFRMINAPKAPNRQFYGKLNLNADVDVTGDMNLPRVNAFLRVNKNTDFYVTLPSDDPEVVDRQGVVVFTNNKQQTDSNRLKSLLDSLASTAVLRGMDVSATIETDSSAQFTLIIDERNGDALALRGRAELAGGIDKSGKVSLTGNYELVNGAYNLTLSVLHRKFVIQRGSVITWTGDPKKANIDITAIYTVNTAPIDLMEDQLTGQSTTEQNRYKTRLPFQVKLNMTGELLKPIIKFDITLPDNLLSLWPDVDTKLTQIRTDEAEVNKQVFALLLLGRFIQENPFQSAGAGTDAGTIARQSASKLLSDQLNQLAGSLVKGVDVNFDLNSDQDYSTGTATNQTDLNVKVSKGLFDDRIRVTVGSDFQLDQTNPGQNANNIAGDVSVDYRLTRDGRYMIRVYRNDQYQTVIQGQVVETGLSFILTFDYNSFRELFQNKKTPVDIPRPPHKKTVPANNTQTTSNNPPAP